MKRNRDISTF